MLKINYSTRLKEIIEKDTLEECCDGVWSFSLVDSEVDVIQLIQLGMQLADEVFNCGKIDLQVYYANKNIGIEEREYLFVTASNEDEAVELANSCFSS
jgi:hypothetical protein